MTPVLNDPMAVAGWLRERVGGGLQCDSRRVAPGDGFVAWPGAATDGRRFVGSALAAGAAAALVERQGVEAFDFADPRIRAVPDLKAQAGPIASAFYGEPTAALEVVAFTGTNGKTTCAWWMAQLLSALQRPCAVVGTLGIGLPPLGDRPSTLVSTGLTTPDPVLLQARLRDMVDQGVKACAIEASSIGLVEGRLNATRIGVAVFTNFSQDHLDFHGDMESYWAAKARLFDWPGLRSAVVNLDDERGTALASALVTQPLDLWTYAIEPGTGSANARLVVQDVGYTPQGMRMTVVERDATGRTLERFPLALAAVGDYNASNVLAVLAAARALGVSLEEAVRACAALGAVPGRMQTVAHRAGVPQPLVLVDYAHTPDALDKALRALQPLALERGGSLWCVVGCGGDRDVGKRPLMAAVAEHQAQRLVLTSDNPRSEDPRAILAQMETGLTHPHAARIEVDRAAAIAWAVGAADARDVVLIAGKGHESTQEVHGVQHPFSDQDHAAQALRQREPQGA